MKPILFVQIPEDRFFDRVGRDQFKAEITASLGDAGVDLALVLMPDSVNYQFREAPVQLGAYAMGESMVDRGELARTIAAEVAAALRAAPPIGVTIAPDATVHVNGKGA